MKLATLNSGSRDGTLVVVSRDLSRACVAGSAAPKDPRVNFAISQCGATPGLTPLR
jgi:Fumarylacetoacetase N-terminal domain 2